MELCVQITHSHSDVKKSLPNFDTNWYVKTTPSLNSAVLSVWEQDSDTEIHQLFPISHTTSGRNTSLGEENIRQSAIQHQAELPHWEKRTIGNQPYNIRQNYLIERREHQAVSHTTSGIITSLREENIRQSAIQHQA